MRFRVPEFFLGVLFAVAIFGIGMLFERSKQAAYPAQTVPKQETSAEVQKAQSPDAELTGATWLTKDAAGFFTMGLVVVGAAQVFMFFIQLRYMSQGMKDATLAAQAADLSARAATAIEFPIVRTGWMGPELMSVDELINPRPRRPYGGAVNDGWPTRFSVIDKIEFRNYGRTPAFALSISCGTAVTNLLPETPIYSTTVRCDPNTVIGPRENREIDLDFGFEITDEQVREIRSLEVVLWFYGRLTFEDVMGRPHDIGFCWRWGRQNEEDSISYFYDEGEAPAVYTAKT
ncbi:MULTISPECIES: hypothetical protein [unclassified Bradyrhizobium]|uniref:hypothetical protein n=1 Tax=unclassified Bradyrhizobium TaxID=2631580 RepID=UPI002916575C|nr:MULTISPECIES: hypothetical protein [unclassified Bradyrhizobium]